MNEKRICICGAGTMGSGIAQAAAQAGFPVILYEMYAPTLEKANLSIQQNLSALVSKAKLSAQQSEAIFNAIHFTSQIGDCRADIFIEAIVEKAEAKIGLFNQLAALNAADAVFASNTSSLSIASIAAGIPHPERVCGMHFFNPATIMKLVEVIRTGKTDQPTIDKVLHLCQAMGKTAVICRDAPGFIVNRVARPYYIEALRLLEEDVADISTIDAVMEAAGFRMGPFKLMDLIGNDVNYAVSCSVFEQLGQPERLRPSSIQEALVKNGSLGRKTKKGYYPYE
jgi:3-hydroxybutyryl-CoA dehydrogenase